MSSNILIKKDGKKYSHEYVATRSVKNRQVICHGTNPSKVLDEAKTKGVKNAVIIYVPKRGMTQLF